MKKTTFYVRSSIKMSTKDHFEHGEDPDSIIAFDLGKWGFFNSIEELANEVGLTPDLGAWGIKDDGRIMCSQLEDANGGPVSPGAYMNLFRENKVVLYSCVYEFQVEFIEGIYTPSSVELGQRFEELEQY